MRARRSHVVRMNLDSLLDTMFNIVGVLVIILILVQLEADQAINFALDHGQGDPASLREHLRSERDRWAALADDYKNLSEQLKECEDEFGTLPEGAVGESNDMPELRTRLGQTAARAEAMRTALEKERETIQILRERLESEADNTMKVLHLPQLRPAPNNAEIHGWICRNGRIYRVEWPEYDVAGEVRKALDLSPSEKISLSSSRVVRVQSHFDSLRLRKGSTEVKLKIQEVPNTSYYRVKKTLHLHEMSVGDTPEDLQQSDSIYTRAIQELDSEKDICTFLVYSDSFEVYLAARRLLDQRGISGRWVGYAMDEDIHIGSSGETQVD